MTIAQRSVNVLRRYADVDGQDQIAAGVFKTTADEIERMIDCIATLERELAEAKAREERLRKLARNYLMLRNCVRDGAGDVDDRLYVHVDMDGVCTNHWAADGSLLDAVMDGWFDGLEPEDRETLHAALQQKGDTNADV